MAARGRRPEPGVSSLSFRLFWGARRNGERVDGILHQVAERLVHHAVARDDRLPGEARRHDGEAPVRIAAGLVAGMAAVLLALIFELELNRLERRQALADLPGGASLFSSFLLRARIQDRG